MSSVGKALVVALDGTSIAPANLGVAHLIPGTNGQALLTSGGVTGWGTAPETKSSWACGTIVIANNQDVTAGIPNVLTGVAVAAGQKFGSTGTGGISGNAFSNNNATTVLCNYGTADSVWKLTCEYQFKNTNATPGYFSNSCLIYINGSISSFPGQCDILTANGSTFFTSTSFATIQAGQTLGFGVIGGGSGGNGLVSGAVRYEYISSTV